MWIFFISDLIVVNFIIIFFLMICFYCIFFSGRDLFWFFVNVGFWF